MSRLRFRISMSLDGFTSGPSQSVDHPLGIGGMQLHQWAFPLRAWRSMHGLDGGEDNESARVVEESMENIGATIMGRNMFGGYPGGWSRTNPWNGWWGNEPPFRHPVFVVTHYRRDPLVLEGGTTFTFVTEGILAALEQAQDAAGGRDIALSGGANIAQQFLKAGLVDEMEINLVPVVLGRGERLFEGTGDDLFGLELVRTVATPRVVHLKFER